MTREEDSDSDHWYLYHAQLLGAESGFVGYSFGSGAKRIAMRRALKCNISHGAPLYKRISLSLNISR